MSTTPGVFSMFLNENWDTPRKDSVFGNLSRSSDVTRSYVDNKLFFEFNVCGLNKNEVSITVTKNTLCISGHNKSRSYVYNVPLDKRFDVSTGKCTLNNGLLTVSFIQIEDKTENTVTFSIED